MPHRRTRTAPLLLAAALVGAALARAAPASAQEAPPEGVRPPAGGILLVTEENPPYNMTDPAAGRPVGIAADLMQAVMERAGIPYAWSVLPWQRALWTARTVPGSCALAATLTEERRDRFAWVAPLAEGGLAVFARSDLPVPADGLAGLRGRPVLIQAGSFAGDPLKQAGLEPMPVQLDNIVPMLLAGRADLLGHGVASGLWLARRGGVAVRQVAQLTRTELGAACQPATDPGLLARMRDALAELRRDGTADAIAGRYR
ncbi:MAG TPA: transporter substrate-binding domain-containing protein [Azospirillaceae bacterium]|nr:transporter substrate-binding domain-containing protein [Azospirillaceae bacterium]